MKNTSQEILAVTIQYMYQLVLADSDSQITKYISVKNMYFSLINLASDTDIKKAKLRY